LLKSDFVPYAAVKRGGRHFRELPEADIIARDDDGMIRTYGASRMC